MSAAPDQDAIKFMSENLIEKKTIKNEIKKSKLKTKI